MDKLINQVLFYMKIVFLLIAFTMTLYILFGLVSSPHCKVLCSLQCLLFLP